jgi:TRAP-type C4-dicarboxylate transport system permease small subunit
MLADPSAADRSSAESDGSLPARLMDKFIGTAGLLLLAIVGVTVLDVFGRYLFNAPLPGGFELTEIMMALLIFVSMPVVTRQDGHIKVDILDLVLPRGARFYQDLLGDLVGVVVGLLLAWGMWKKAGDFSAYGGYTDVLKIPSAPVAYVIALMMLLTAAIFAARFYRGLRRRSIP